MSAHALLVTMQTGHQRACSFTTYGGVVAAPPAETGGTAGAGFVAIRNPTAAAARPTMAMAARINFTATECTSVGYPLSSISNVAARPKRNRLRRFSGCCSGRALHFGGLFGQHDLADHRQFLQAATVGTGPARGSGRALAPDPNE